MHTGRTYLVREEAVEQPPTHDGPPIGVHKFQEDYVPTAPWPRHNVVDDAYVNGVGGWPRGECRTPEPWACGHVSQWCELLTGEEEDVHDGVHAPIEGVDVREDLEDVGGRLGHVNVLVERIGGL